MNNHTQNFFNQSKALLCLIDMSGIFVAVNDSWTRILGYSAEELIGKNYADFIHPDDLKASLTEYEVFLDGDSKKTSYINRFRRKDGLYSWLEWSGNIEADIVYAMARDCSQTQEAQERLDLALDIVKLGVWDWNIIENKLIWDDRMFELYGVDPKTVTHDFDMWKNAVHPDDVEAAIQDVETALSAKKTFRSSFRVIHSDGSIRHLSGLAHIFLDEKGTPIRMLGANEDITFSKELELENDKQKRIVEHQAKLVVLGEMSAAIGHEIFNPLNVLCGFIDMQKDSLDLANFDKVKANYALTKQKEAALKIKKICDELKKFSRVESKDLSAVAIVDTVRDAIDFINPILTQANINVETKLENPQCLVKGTEGKIQQIIYNLVVNAKDAMAGEERKELKIEGKKIDNIYSIKVIDNGHGIEEQIQNKIFDPFYTTKKIGKGTGLGLSLSQQFARLLGGELELFQSSSKGSSFGLSLAVVG